MTELSGSCACGSVQYEVNGDVRDIVACHCQECRKMSGHFTAATATAPQNLQLVNDDTLRWYRSSPVAERGFCSHCGSTLFYKPDSGDRISIFAGSIDGKTGLPMTSHIYTGEKGDYYDIDDDTDQFEVTGAALTLE